METISLDSTRFNEMLTESGKFAGLCNSVSSKLPQWHPAYDLSNSWVCICTDGTTMWRVTNKYHVLVAKFNHKPSETEINNALVEYFHLNKSLLIH